MKFEEVEKNCDLKIKIGENVECRHRRLIISGLDGCLCREDNCFVATRKPKRIIKVCPTCGKTLISVHNKTPRHKNINDGEWCDSDPAGLACYNAEKSPYENAGWCEYPGRCKAKHRVYEEGPRGGKRKTDSFMCEGAL